MIQSMTLTTIKLSSDLRDTLKKQAALRRRTLGEHLSALAEEEERRTRFAALALAMEARPADADYTEEARHWTSDSW